MTYAWPSSVNPGSYVTVRLSLKQRRSRNFSMWKEQMLCLLESQDVVGFVNGEIPPPENVEGDRKVWRRTDRLVKGWIMGSIEKDTLAAVWRKKTARDVWLHLSKIFTDGGEEEDDEDDENNDDDHDECSDASCRYLMLYKAAQRGEWEKAQNLLKYYKDGLSAIIKTGTSETALHVAVSTGKANKFVKKLVELMPPEALALKDSNGETPLHCAAIVGNTEAAKALVNKNPDLLYIPNKHNDLPVTKAAGNCQKETLKYLISVSKPNSQFQGQMGVELLRSVIASEFFDVALDLVDKYPHLVRLKDEDGGWCALSTIAGMRSAFPSGEAFTRWQSFVYYRILPKQSKCKVDPETETSTAGDIEKNTSRHAPASSNHLSHLWKKLLCVMWDVAEYLVPRMKEMKEKREMHTQAIQLVKKLCKEMSYLPEKKATSMFLEPILTAADNGISEIVEEIMEVFPLVSLYPGGEAGINVFFRAATYRYEKVFNLINSFSDRKFLVYDDVDDAGNNLMHVCGKLAPADRLNLVPGAALQMQRELQWFKEMEKFVHTSRRIWTNKEDETPKQVFTKEHQKLKADGEKWMKDTAQACNLAALFIATVMFSSAFTLPGDLKPNGTPVLLEEFAFHLFAVSDAISLFTAITALLMFISILTSRYAEEDFLYLLPKRLTFGLVSLFVAITFMLAAFSSAIYLLFREKLAWIFAPVMAVACLPVTAFVLLQFPLLVEVVNSTYGPGLFGKKTQRILY